MKREKHTLLKKGDLWIDPDTMRPWSGIMFSTFKGTSVIEEWMPVQNGQAHGVWETFYPDSSPKARVGFLNGVLHGIDEEFTKEGKPLRHAINENGKRSGVSTFWEYGSNKTLLKKYSKKDGVLHGEYEEYFGGGDFKEKGSYSNGLKHGVWESYLQRVQHEHRGRDDALRERINWSQGKKHGPYEYYHWDGTWLGVALHRRVDPIAQPNSTL